MTVALHHPRGAGVRDVALWSGAAAVALATHVGLGLWASRQVVEPLVGETAPPAIMIDMAPEPVAPEAEIERITPDAIETPEIESVNLDAPPALEPPPAPMEPPPPLDTPPTLEAPPEPDPVVEPPAIAAPPDIVSEVVEPPPTRPSARPPEPPKEQAPKEPKPEAKPAAPEQARVKAAIDAAPAATAAAAQTSAGTAGTSRAPQKWLSKVVAHLARHTRYPSPSERRGDFGTAQVAFTVDDGGRVTSVQLTRSSGFPELDEAALATVRRASPVPAPPEGAPRNLNAPIVFRKK